MSLVGPELWDWFAPLTYHRFHDGDDSFPSKVNLAESHMYKIDDPRHHGSYILAPSSDPSSHIATHFHLCLSLLMVRFSMLRRGACNPDSLSSGHPGAPHSSHMSAQSANGPNTFDEALRHLRFSMEDLTQISDDHFYGSSTNSLAEPPVIPHPSHLLPQGYPSESIYHYNSQYAPPNQAIPATHHQGTRHSCSSRPLFSTALLTCCKQ